MTSHFFLIVWFCIGPRDMCLGWVAVSLLLFSFLSFSLSLFFFSTEIPYIIRMFGVTGIGRASISQHGQ
ncbi:hypothetical protein BDV23DRAFT_41965 [Aspergillus alliaceus]|uniref:Uncharacterized protein n=1 Tax=Petromyces alliaceus TaxID=209559 RepID=A0A5N7CGL7_PETAA|nr:hypothetical protein BDV23DRAFT_41965 [Aspergillus alliaceus]